MSMRFHVYIGPAVKIIGATPEDRDRLLDYLYNHLDGEDLYFPEVDSSQNPNAIYLLPNRHIESMDAYHFCENDYNPKVIDNVDATSKDSVEAFRKMAYPILKDSGFSLHFEWVALSYYS